MSVMSVAPSPQADARQVPPVEGEPSWWPTRKWWAALISGAFSIGAHAFGSGGWGHTEWAELLTLAASLTTAYGALNAPTAGGVPIKRS
jgi:hypothetical protein